MPVFFISNLVRRDVKHSDRSEATTYKSVAEEVSHETY